MTSTRRHKFPSCTKAYALAALLCVESAVVIAALVLFGVAYPDRFRSRLWRNGGEEGWCSNPRLRIYFYANHEEPPEIPLIWSQRLTTLNTAVSFLSLAVLFARITMAALEYSARWTNVAYDVFLAVLWACSAAAQNGADLSDPAHLMPRPWYLGRGCDEAWVGNRGWCKLAKWEFVWAIIAASFYTARVLGSLGLMVYDKGRKDAGTVGQTHFMDEREISAWAASYKDADDCPGCDLADLTSYRS